MRRRLLPILILLIVMALAAFGLIMRRVQISNPQEDSRNLKVNQAEVTKVQLVQLDIDSNTPTVGQPIVFNFNLNDLSTNIAAISIGLRLPYEATPPLELAELPFSIHETLADAGWQILVNQVKDNSEDKVIEAEIAIGVMNQQSPDEKTTGADGLLELPHPFLQLTLPTSAVVADGRIMIDPVLTKVIDDTGETLPVQLTTQPYKILSIDTP